jgi:enterochelin esterase-like enzyme
MRVRLEPPDWATHLLSDLTDWQRAPLPVAELAPFDLPDDAYFEYAYRDADGRERPDPDNDEPSRNPWWPYARPLAGPDYRPGPYADLADARPRGRIVRTAVASAQLGERRPVLVYSPAGYADAALPQVVFQDGKAYYGWGRVPQVFDRLLAAGEVEPAHLVFVPPLQRTREYAFNDAYVAFLVDELLPEVSRRARCDGRRVAWGASLGGLLSARLAWLHPLVFQTVVTQSGAFLYEPGQDLTDTWGGGEWLLAEVRAGVWRPLRWHLFCGTLEWLIHSNRRLAAALSDKGYDVELSERNAGHNWVNWRDGLAGGLRFALGR